MMRRHQEKEHEHEHEHAASVAVVQSNSQQSPFSEVSEVTYIIIHDSSL